MPSFGDTNHSNNTLASLKKKLKSIRPYWELMRFHKPIGIWLLLWPTWWGLWLSAEGLPDFSIWVIFTLGVVVTRAAGCVINDIADRRFDRQVARTHQRPLAAGVLTLRQAKITLIILSSLALLLVLLTNLLTLYLSFLAAGMACLYPFMKRYTHLPQVVLGAAFSMSIPMAFAAQTGEVPALVILVYLTNLLWTVVYDTYYGMVDLEDDKKIGVKSTAILFEGSEAFITGSIQAVVLIGLLLTGQRFGLHWPYFFAVAVASSLMIYHQILLRQGRRQSYFKAFENNHWIGAVIFLGIALNTMLD
ncbi:MAG: 4-hydroxybenzoate polyprenyltransferase [Cellvibrionaceae bacterium]|jgi:4-hydroxybenzoate polyprenyltransferase